jgi:uroporphyrinogen decarboxylase
MGRLSEMVYASKTPLPYPVLTAPGAALTGVELSRLFNDSDCQVAAARAVRVAYNLPFWQSSMDLSVEAEEFGCAIRFDDDETPSILGRLVHDASEAEALAIPRVGSGRSAVYLRTLGALARDSAAPFVIGGAIGPFSLAGRIFGLSEALMATVMEPELIKLLLEKATAYVIDYALAQREAGAAGLMIAEPSSGLLSPPALAEFSGAYVKRVVDAVQTEDFEIVLHNCAATSAHLDAVYAAGAKGYHFGAPMDMSAALGAAPAGAIVGGNLDPTKAFCSLDPEGMRIEVLRLRELAAGHPGFFLSSGCDVSCRAPDATIRAFFSAASE